RPLLEVRASRGLHLREEDGGSAPLARRPRHRARGVGRRLDGGGPFSVDGRARAGAGARGGVEQESCVSRAAGGQGMVGGPSPARGGRTVRGVLRRQRGPADGGGGLAPAQGAAGALCGGDEPPSAALRRLSPRPPPRDLRAQRLARRLRAHPMPGAGDRGIRGQLPYRGHVASGRRHHSGRSPPRGRGWPALPQSQPSPGSAGGDRRVPRLARDLRCLTLLDPPLYQASGMFCTSCSWPASPSPQPRPGSSPLPVPAPRLGLFDPLARRSLLGRVVMEASPFFLLLTSLANARGLPSAAELPHGLLDAPPPPAADVPRVTTEGRSLA